MRVKKIIYHVVLFFIPMLIILGILALSTGRQSDFSPFNNVVLGYLAVVSLISFALTYPAQKSLGTFAYIIPAVLLIPVLFYIWLSVIENPEFGMILVIWYPFFISCLVYITGFIAYQKWILKKAPDGD